MRRILREEVLPRLVVGALILLFATMAVVALAIICTAVGNGIDWIVDVAAPAIKEWAAGRAGIGDVLVMGVIVFFFFYLTEKERVR